MASLLTCPYCGAHVSRGAHYCERCGIPVNESSTPRRRRQPGFSVWVTMALAGLIIGLAGVDWWFEPSFMHSWFQTPPETSVHVPSIPTDLVDYQPDLATTQPPDETTLAPGHDYQDVLQAILPSIVSVTAHGTRGTSTGTGFLYDVGGRIVTSYHVIEGADRIEVIDGHGERHRAHKVQHEANRDLAMLYVPTLEGATPLGLAPPEARVEPGAHILVFGSPLGPGVPYVEGIVGGVGQQVRCEDRPFYDLMTLTAVVAKGNSGGPVIDPKTGQVLGIIVCRADHGPGLGLSYAMPVRAAANMLQQWAGLPNPTGIAPVNRATRTVPVRIGLLGALSGANATVSTPLAEGATLAIQEMAPMLLALGYDVDLKLYDTLGRLDMGTEMASRIQYDKDLVALIGTLEAETAGAVMPQLRAESIAVIEPVNSDPGMTQNGWQNYFRLLAPDNLQGLAAADFLADRGASTVYVVEDSTAYGSELASFFVQAAKAKGLRVISMDIATDEVAIYVGERIAQAKPDAVYAGGRATTLATVLKTARAQGYTNLIIGPDGLNDPRLAAEVGGEALYFTSPGRPLPEAFKKLFEKAYQKPASPLSALGYDATRIILEALERYGKEHPGRVPTREELTGLIRSTTGFVGWMVASTFDHMGENVDAAVFVFEWEGYEPHVVATFRP